jgi:hypothetical protein
MGFLVMEGIDLVGPLRNRILGRRLSFIHPLAELTTLGAHEAIPTVEDL